jgi:hypothetical protein
MWGVPETVRLGEAAGRMEKDRNAIEYEVREAADSGHPVVVNW